MYFEGIMNMLSKVSFLVFLSCFVLSESTLNLNKDDLSSLRVHVSCEQHCRQTFHRSCSDNPPTCGPCASNHIERDGVCLSLKSEAYNPEGEIEDMVDSVHGQDRVRFVRADGTNEVSEAVQATTNTQESNSRTMQPIPNISYNSAIFIAVVVGCSVAGVVGLIVAGVCWYRLQKNVKATSEVDYPAYGVTGPTNGKDRLGSPGDRKLAQSAQMYHYQHQKQQMIAMEKAHGDLNKDGSEVDSDDENEEGDYTVFECPGLAPTGEMEVKNPLFSEDTPVTPAVGESRSEPK